MQCPKQLLSGAAWLFACLAGLLLPMQSIAGYFYVSHGLQSDRQFHEAGHRTDRLERREHRRVRADTTDIAWLMKELSGEEELRQPVAWLRVLGPSGGVLVQAGKPTGSPAVKTCDDYYWSARGWVTDIPLHKERSL